MTFGRGLAWIAGAAVAVAVAVVAFLSCLPTLGQVAVPPSIPPLCGNGIIDLDAGEQCDPGEAGAAAGCTRWCAIDCTAEAGAFQDPQTGHCYFPASPLPLPFGAAWSGCDDAGAHVVTFVSTGEFDFVAGADQVGTFWVGIQRSTDGDEGGTPNYLPVSGEPNEPGWAPFSTCAGCYAHLRDPVNDTAFPRYNPGSGPVTGVCVAGIRNAQAWAQLPCAGYPLRALCEREPPGSRAVPCGDAGSGLWCITVANTGANQPMKKYVYNPTLSAPKEARDWCVSIPGGKLVIFDTREEREQLLRELIHLPVPPTEFWIGLVHGVFQDAGGAADASAPWIWDDGIQVVLDPTAHRPPPWGNLEPVPSGPARAYIVQQAGNYDTQLAYADVTGTPRPFVCQCSGTACP